MTHPPLPEPIAEGFRRLRWTARRQAAVIACITSLMEFLMTDQEDINKGLDDAEAAVEADEAEDDLDISERDATIKAQQALIAELQAGKIDVPATIARLQSITAKLHKGGTPTEA